MQFWPPDDEHMCLKHVEAWNKLTVKQKFCASSWLITEINIPRYTTALPGLTFCSDYNLCYGLFHVNVTHCSLSVSSVRCEGTRNNIMPQKLDVIREGVNFGIFRHTASIHMATYMCMPNVSSIWPTDIFNKLLIKKEICHIFCETVIVD